MIIRTIQVVVEQTQLLDQKHTFIYNGTAGAGYHIGFAVPLFEYHAGDVQLPVEFQTLFTVVRLLDERLHDVRHAVQSLGAQNVRIYRYFTPAQKFQMFLFQHFLKSLHCLFVFFLGLREEEHGDTIFPFAADLDSSFFCHFRKISVRDLQQNAYAVTRLALGVFTGSVLQCFYNSECTVHHFPVRCAVHVDNRTDTAVLVFKTRVIQAVLCKRLLVSVVIHSHFSFARCAK